MRRWGSCALGFAASWFAEVLLGAVQGRFGDPLTAALVAAGDGWQVGKAVFFPLLCAAPVVWWLGGGSRSGLCAAVIPAAAIAPVAAIWLPVALAVPLTMAAALALYGAALHRMPERWGWCVATVALAAAYILLTLLEWRGALSAMTTIPF